MAVCQVSGWAIAKSLQRVQVGFAAVVFLAVFLQFVGALSGRPDFWNIVGIFWPWRLRHLAATW